MDAMSGDEGDLFASALHNAAIGMALVARDGRFVAVNHALCRDRAPVRRPARALRSCRRAGRGGERVRRLPHDDRPGSRPASWWSGGTSRSTGQGVGARSSLLV